MQFHQNLFLEDKLEKLKKDTLPKTDNPMQKFVKVKKTIKKYKLGKNSKNRSIAVLVKSEGLEN